MTPRPPVAAVVSSLAGLALLLTAGCSGDSDRSITLPSSLTTLTTESTATTSGTDHPATGETEVTVPEIADAPELTSITAELVQTACTAPEIPVDVTFEAAPEPPVRWFSVFVGTTQAGLSKVPGTLSVAVPCDGTDHSILVIATGENGRTSTESVAVRTPSPG